MILFFSFLLALLVIYSPVISFDYLFHDDVYFWIKEVWSPYHYFHKTLVSMGRPLAAWVCTIDNHWVNGIGDLKLLRFLAIICFSGCAFLFFRRLRSWLNNDLQAWCVAVMIVTLPGAEVNVFYSIGWFFSLAVLVSCLAFELSDSVKWWRMVAASLVFLMAITLNQTAAMCYWLMLLIGLLGGYKRVISSLFIGIAGLIQYGLVLWFIRLFNAKSAATPFYNPNQMEMNFFNKIWWFFQEPLVNALNLWQIFPSGWVAWGMAVFIIVALGMAWRVGAKESSFKWSVVTVCVLGFLSFLPNLAASGKAPFYRCLIALSPMVLVAFIWALKKYQQIFLRSRSQVVLTGIVVIMVVAAGTTAFANVLYHRVLPSHQETRLFQAMAHAKDYAIDDQILIILPAREKALERYDEFGVWTVHYQQDIVLLLKCVFEEAGIVQWPAIFVKSPDSGHIFRLEGYVYWIFPHGVYQEGQLGRQRLLALKDFGINPADVLMRFQQEKITRVEGLLPKANLFILDLQSVKDDAGEK